MSKSNQVIVNKTNKDDVTVNLTVSHGFKVSFDQQAKDNDETYECTLEVIFENVKFTDILTDAIKSNTIKVQRDLKSKALGSDHLKEMLEAKDYTVAYKYDDIGGTQQLTASEKALKALSKLTPEQQEAVKAAWMESQKQSA